MPMIERSETLQLGGATIDANHVEFCTLLDAIVDASDTEFVSALDAFIDHTEHHFAGGNTWMSTVDFPPYHCHRGEYDNVLALCHEVRECAAVNEMELGRRLVAELPAWSVQHVDVMGRMMATYPAQMGNTMYTIGHVG